MKTKNTPHFNNRTSKIDMIVIHCSAFSAKDLIPLLEQEGVSTHYIIDTDGTLIQIVPDNKRAYHAGTGSWGKIKEDINSHAIGIELCHKTLGQTPYSKKQITTLAALCQKLIKKYKIDPKNIIGHSDMAPARKSDPGKSFPWQKLAKNNIGLWYDLKNANQITTSDPIQLLHQIGYDTTNPIAAAYAFRRHFMPDTIRTRKNIRHLILHPYPPRTTKLPKDKHFIQTLRAVAYAYSKKD